MKLAPRVGKLTTSPTVATMELAQRLRRQGRRVIDLGPGQPDFPVPEPIRRAAIRAVEEGWTGYTPVAGLPELRQAVAESYNARWGTRFTAENVIITAGAKSAVYLVCATLFAAGDRVAVPVPYWVTFPAVVSLVEAEPVFVGTAVGDFRPPVDALRRMGGVQGAILNFPNNPSGTVATAAEFTQIAAWAATAGAFVLSDETYELFTYEEEEPCSFAPFALESRVPFAVVGSFSKSCNMTGWRIGYVITDAHFARRLADFQSHHAGNASTIGQWGALAALELGFDWLTEVRQDYRRRRDLLLEGLRRIPGVSCAVPAGAFYLFPDVRELLRQCGCGDSGRFALHLLEEAEVAVVPGSAFGCEGYVRLSYAVPPAELSAAVERIAAFARSHRCGEGRGG
ncbi:MAG: pyridoxal phosphate-dependent aminotransferase [Acidobacteriota bacterium]